MNELDELMSAKVFKIVDRSSLPADARIYSTQTLNFFKENNGMRVIKSRLVAHNFRYKHANSIPTKISTISKTGQRVPLAIAAMDIDGTTCTRDVVHQYHQSKSRLERDVYLRPPAEMNLQNSKLRLALKPLYGIAISGLH